MRDNSLLKNVGWDERNEAHAGWSVCIVKANEIRLKTHRRKRVSFTDSRYYILVWSSSLGCSRTEHTNASKLRSYTLQYNRTAPTFRTVLPPHSSETSEGNYYPMHLKPRPPNFGNTHRESVSTFSYTADYKTAALRVYKLLFTIFIQIIIKKRLLQIKVLHPNVSYIQACPAVCTTTLF
jgi:hypothetical protein